MHGIQEDIQGILSASFPHEGYPELAAAYQDVAEGLGTEYLWHPQGLLIQNTAPPDLRFNRYRILPKAEALLAIQSAPAGIPSWVLPVGLAAWRTRGLGRGVRLLRRAS